MNDGKQGGIQVNHAVAGLVVLALAALIVLHRIYGVIEVATGTR